MKNYPETQPDFSTANALFQGDLRRIARLRHIMLVTRTLTYLGGIGWMIFCCFMAFSGGGIFITDQNAPVYMVSAVVAIGVVSVLFTMVNQALNDREVRTMQKITAALFPKAKFTTLCTVDKGAMMDSRLFTEPGMTPGQLQLAIYGQLTLPTTEGNLLIQDIGVSAYNSQAVAPGAYLTFLYRTLLLPLVSPRSSTGVHSFRGLFSYGTLPRPARGFVLLLPDHMEDKLGYLAHTIQAMRKQNGASLVKMEDPEFERLFAVYADDEVEARMLLTPAMMQRITALRNAFPRDLMLSFVENRFYFASSTPDGFLRPGRIAVTNNHLLEQLHKEITFCAEISHMIR